MIRQNNEILESIDSKLGGLKPESKELLTDILNAIKTGDATLATILLRILDEVSGVTQVTKTVVVEKTITEYVSSGDTAIMYEGVENTLNDIDNSTKTTTSQEVTASVNTNDVKDVLGEYAYSNQDMYFSGQDAAIVKNMKGEFREISKKQNNNDWKRYCIIIKEGYDKVKRGIDENNSKWLRKQEEEQHKKKERCFCVTGIHGDVWVDRCTHRVAR